MTLLGFFSNPATVDSNNRTIGMAIVRMGDLRQVREEIRNSTLASVRNRAHFINENLRRHLPLTDLENPQRENDDNLFRVDKKN